MAKSITSQLQKIIQNQICEKLENLAGKYEDLNLYASLGPKVIEITLNNDDTTTTINATYDGKYDKLKEQTKAGYDFLGWYTGETDGIKITSETEVKEESPVTLAANEIAEGKVTVC